MINQDIIAQDLFYKIRSRFPKMEMGDKSGQATFESSKGRFFDFDAVFNGVDLGKVSISINEPGSLKLYFSKNILENIDELTTKTWFSFLREMRKFAMKRLMSFDTRDIAKTNLDKRDFSYLAQKGSVMNESSMKGTSKTSYRPLNNTKLIIRHKENINPDIPGARSRKIERLFIESPLGERYLMPFKYLEGAKAMQRHVANGGTPHDDLGKKIVEMCSEIAQLTNFKNYVQHEDLMNTETNHIVDRAKMKLESLKATVHRLTGQKNYESYRNSFSSLSSENSPLIDEITLQEFKDKFTVKKFKEDIAEVFPLLYKIMQEENELDLSELAKAEDELKELNLEQLVKETPEFQFDRWASTLIETKMTEEDLERLKTLLDEHFPVGINGENVTSTLEQLGLNLPNAVKESLLDLYKSDGADADAKNLVIEFLSKFEPEIYNSLMISEDDSEIQQQETTGEEMNLENMDDDRRAANEYVRKISAAIKSGEVSADDVKDDFFYTLEMYGIDDEKIFAAWDRITNHSNTPKRAPMSDKDIDKELKGIDSTDDDDDAQFISNLRSKAKTSGIKQDVTGFGAGLDEESDKKDRMSEIAEFIMSFYDRENGTFPLGETGVALKVSKEYGEDAGKLAEMLCKQMTKEREERDAFEELKMLSGMKKPAEGNLFTGNLAKAREQGKKQADLDGDGDMEKVHGENVEAESQDFDFSAMRRLAGIK